MDSRPCDEKDGRNQGRPRYRVLYRLGGRESRARYAGSFTTKAQALARERWVDGELAALRVPDIAILTAEPVRAPSIREACDEWRASRVDVTEATQVLHRVALARVIPVLGAMCVDEVGEIDVQRLVTELAGKGKKRETIRKSVKYLAAVLDEHGRDPNPARSRRVRLPHEEREEMQTVCHRCWHGMSVGAVRRGTCRPALTVRDTSVSASCAKTCEPSEIPSGTPGTCC